MSKIGPFKLFNFIPTEKFVGLNNFIDIIQMNTTTVCETSDPENHLEYTGTLLASNTNSLQSWKILDTKENGEMLFINDIHQSSKKDEYYYHEMFVHSLLFGIASPKTVLVLGGSEGCMAR